MPDIDMSPHDRYCHLYPRQSKGVEMARKAIQKWTEPQPELTAGLELMRMIACSYPSREATSMRRAKGITRQHHQINEHEFIDTETHFQVEESYSESEFFQ
jgi:hypothetical protein